MPALTFFAAQRGRLWLRLSPVNHGWPFTHPSEPPRWALQGLALQGHDLAQPPWQAPWLFEWQHLEWMFWPEVAAPWQPPFSFWQNGQSLGLAMPGPSSGVLLGGVSLRGQVGYLDWELRDAAGRVIWRLEAEVFPQRLRYRADFRSMLSAVQDWQAGLPFGPPGATYLPLRPQAQADHVNPLWPEHMLASFDTLTQSLDRLLRAPDTRLQHGVILRPPAQVRRLRVPLAPWLAQHPQYRGATAAPEQARLLPDATVQPSYDTPANRLVAHALRTLLGVLLEATTRVDAWPKERQHLWYRLIQQTQRYLRHPVLRAVGALSPAWRDQLLPYLGAPYQHFYQSWQALMQPLALSEGPGYRFTPRDTPTLYEYWCLVYLASSLTRAHGYQWLDQQLIAGREVKARLPSAHQLPGYLRFVHPESGQRVTLWYQREFGRQEIGTFAQRPDMVLDIEPRSGSGPRRYLLEVKYQASQGAEGWGPPREGLAQVHRYRDAILTREAGIAPAGPLRSEGGMVLFPPPGDASAFWAHPAYRGWRMSGVGALPMQPGHPRQALFDAWLREILSEDAAPMLREPALSYGQREQLTQAQALTQPVWLLAIPHDEHVTARWHFVWQNRAWFLPWREALPTLSAVALVDPARHLLVGVAEKVSLRFAHARDLRRLGSSWPHRAAEGKYLLIEWDDWQPSALRLYPPWPAQSNLAALRLALRQKRSDALWVDTLGLWRRWLAALAVDPDARLSPEDAGGHWVWFTWQEQAYRLWLDHEARNWELWRGDIRLQRENLPENLEKMLPENH